MNSIKTSELYARMLGEENLKVSYDKDAETAYFKPSDRSITLPIWNGISKTAEQHICSHEIGHALYTDFSVEELVNYKSMYGDILDVIEDVYIEQKIKNRYAGLISVFKEGFISLVENGIFDVKKEEVPFLGFLDRVNLYFKGGFYYNNIEFSDEEQNLVAKLFNIKDNNEVLELCKEFKDFIDEHKEKKQDSDENNNEENNEQEKDSEQSQESESKKSSSRNVSSDEKQNNEQKDSSENYESDNSEDSEQDNCEEQEDSEELEELDGNNSKESAKGNVTDEEEQIQHTVNDTDYSCDTLHKFEENLKSKLMKNDNESCSIHFNTSAYKAINKLDYPEFVAKAIVDRTILDESSIKRTENEKKKIMGIVEKSSSAGNAYFQMLKTAHKVSETKRKTSGIIDTKRLFSYKTNDNIFKSLKVTPNETNHGIVFGLDISGSMESHINNVFIQAIILFDFCKKNDIVFDAYLFGKNVYNICNSNTYKLENMVSLMLSFTKKKGGLAVYKEYIKQGYNRDYANINTLATESATSTLSYLLTISDVVRNWRLSGIEKIYNIVITDGHPCESNYFTKEGKSASIYSNEHNGKFTINLFGMSQSNNLDDICAWQNSKYNIYINGEDCSIPFEYFAKKGVLYEEISRNDITLVKMATVSAFKYLKEVYGVQNILDNLCSTFASSHLIPVDMKKYFFDTMDDFNKDLFSNAKKCYSLKPKGTVSNVEVINKKSKNMSKDENNPFAMFINYDELEAKVASNYADEPEEACVDGEAEEEDDFAMEGMNVDYYSNYLELLYKDIKDYKLIVTEIAKEIA